MRKAKQYRNEQRDALMELVAQAFDREALARVCSMDEHEFATTYGMDTVSVPQKGADYYHYRATGSNVLAVAHLDTVADAATRTAQFVDTEGGTVVFSRALDDRLGAYIILELLPALGINYDVLLTTGEEEGRSTAAYFEPDKQYDWMIEFDRGGTDVVMYEYEDDDTCIAVERSGARVGDGIFSDIAYLGHLEIKGWNWGVGYRDYHGPRAHAFLDDTFEMVAYYLLFHEQNKDRYWPHEERKPDAWWRSYRDDAWLETADDLECERIFGKHGDVHEDCDDVIASMP